MTHSSIGYLTWLIINMTNNQLARRVLEVVALSMCELTNLFRRMPDLTVTVGQFRVMNMVARGIDRVSKLADTYGSSEPAMSKMVDVLVKQGLTDRQLCLSDRRQFVVSLTEQGKPAANFAGVNACSRKWENGLRVFRPRIGSC